MSKAFNILQSQAYWQMAEGKAMHEKGREEGRELGVERCRIALSFILYK